MKDLNLVQKTGWLASSALLLTALPAAASSNGLCGEDSCVLVALLDPNGTRVELYYEAGEAAENGTWSVDGVRISRLGGADWQPIVGDFDADKDDDLAVYRDGVFRIQWNETGRTPVTTYTLPSTDIYNANSIPVVGNWDGIGGDDLGLYTDGTFKLYPDTTDFTDTITIDFGTLPQIPGFAFTQMPISGPIDDGEENPNFIARVGIYFGTYAQYAPETVDSTFAFTDVTGTDAKVKQYERPHFYARPTVLNVADANEPTDFRMVFMMPPGLAALDDDSACTEENGYDCLPLFPERPDTQQPVVTPPPDDFN